MPLIQGGPPEWVWERPDALLKVHVMPVEDAESHPVFEVRIDCGMEIVRLQYLTWDEIQELNDSLCRERI